MNEVERRMHELGSDVTKVTSYEDIDHEANIILYMIRGFSREAAIQEVQLEATFNAAHTNLLERRLGSIDDNSADIEEEY